MSQRRSRMAQRSAQPSGAAAYWSPDHRTVEEIDMGNWDVLEAAERAMDDRKRRRLHVEWARFLKLRFDYLYNRVRELVRHLRD